MREIRDVDLFIEMIKNDLKWFFETLLLCKKAKLMLIAGAVTKKYYINEFLNRFAPIYGFEFLGAFHRRDNIGKGKIAYHELRGNGIRLPIFFCSTSPSSNDKHLLIERIEENSAKLIHLIANI